MENSYLEITLALDQKIFICPYKVNKDLGNFLLIDAFSKKPSVLHVFNKFFNPNYSPQKLVLVYKLLINNILR